MENQQNRHLQLTIQDNDRQEDMNPGAYFMAKKVILTTTNSILTEMKFLSLLDNFSRNENFGQADCLLQFSFGAQGNWMPKLNYSLNCLSKNSTNIP